MHDGRTAFTRLAAVLAELGLSLGTQEYDALGATEHGVDPGNPWRNRSRPNARSAVFAERERGAEAQRRRSAEAQKLRSPEARMRCTSSAVASPAIVSGRT
ncbi:hypothetical protein GCM10010275_14670 [Streptomyces litmocidini]|nr:hypothetical protein GCM10010275_14670 [Streptomyces litmocidini]